MIPYPYEPVDTVICGCCGKLVDNTPEHNVDLHAPEGDPYRGDEGYGMCVDCGGDPKVDPGDLSEAAIRRRLGWGMTCFYDARIEVLREKLNDANRAHFESLSYAKKVALIARAVEEGIMI